MASQRLKRSMRGALAATAVIVAAVGLNSTVATADTPANTPPPASNDPVAEFNQLSQQAATLGEQVHTAQANLDAAKAKAQSAQNDIGAAQQVEKDALAQENQYMGQVDKLTSASFEGARLSQMAALLTGTSVHDFLNRASDLQDLATDSSDTLSKFDTAVNAAKSAEDRAQKDLQTAQQAQATAQTAKDQLDQQMAQLTQQISQLAAQKAKLAPQQQAQLKSAGIPGQFFGPPGMANDALQVALGKRGSEYVWGAAGPNTFDCSGLVIYSYGQVGMPGLPHSSSVLSTMGQAVDRANLQPGDLVFFGHPVHHVGIYVGNGDMVDAPDFGQVVKVEPLDNDYEGARRLAP